MAEPTKLGKSLYCKITERGIFAGGAGSSNVIQYITINSPSSATDFGDLRKTRTGLTATSNGIDERGIFTGGNTNAEIEFINITTIGVSTGFGDLTQYRYYLAGTSNATNQRGVFGSGSISTLPPIFTNIIDYITINTLGDAIDFGDVTIDRYYLSSTSNGTNERGVFGGGYDGTNSIRVNIIDYITINSTGDSTDFGDLTAVKQGVAACSNETNERGVFGGGHTGSHSNVIEYITINSTSDATDFGDLTVARSYLAATSNGTNERGVFGGGDDVVYYTNYIDYITINSIGDATDFNDLLTANSKSSATSNGTGVNKISIYDSTCTVDATACMDHFLKIYTGGDRGVFGGGFISVSDSNIIDYITIRSTGDASDFGDLTTIIETFGATSNGANERGVFGGGYRPGGANNIIEYITISSTGDALDFGDLTVSRYDVRACSNGTNERGVFGGGQDVTHGSIIDYITISSTGNATDFGDFNINIISSSGTSNGTNERGIFGGTTSGAINTIEYITINSPSSATDFGDLTVGRWRLGGTSNGTNERGVFGGGTTGSNSNVIDYITINSTSDATDFGDLFQARNGIDAVSNATNERGAFGGGINNNRIDYITISTTGDASDFGDLTEKRFYIAATSDGEEASGYIQMTPILIDEKATNIRVSDGNTTFAILRSFSEFTYLQGDIAVCCGGMTDEEPTYGINTIEYVNISTPGNASDFGDSVRTRNDIGATSNGINQRGVFIAGCGSSINNTIDYITINITSNATDFGDASQKVMFIGACSNGTNERGIFGGGSRLSSPVINNVIEYITINSISDASDFGDLTVARSGLSAISNGTNERGVFGGGYIGDSTRVNIIDYTTINSTGDASDFGDLSVGKDNLTSTSNGINERGIFGGGYTGSSNINVIEYITINSTGDATDFGDLTEIKRDMWCTSNTTNERGLFGGGYNGSGDRVNVIEYITINSTGNGSDFGDLTIPKAQLAATSNT